MCQYMNEPHRIQMVRCSHGTYHLTIGDTTLHLSASTMKMLTRLIFRTVQEHGEQLKDDVRSQAFHNRNFGRVSDN